MRLRTEMTDFHGRTLPRSSMPQPHFDFEHDAMAAHAYKRELANMRKAAEMTPRTHERQLVLNLLDVLDRRAAEILAGWLGEERKS